MRTLLIFSIAGLFLLSCAKEEPLTGRDQLKQQYSEFLQQMELNCPKDSSPYYFRGSIRGAQTCYYDGVDGIELEFQMVTIFTTPDPSMSGTGSGSDLRRGAHLAFEHNPLRQGEEYIAVVFPEFDIDRDPVEYLDSIFAIEEHTLAPDNFIINLMMMDLLDTNEGLLYRISSEFGTQSEGYIRFTKVKKVQGPDGLYYDLEIELECDLYHWKNYGYEGYWGSVKNGRVKARISVP